MRRPRADDSVLATLLSIDRTHRWTLDGALQLDFDAGHPQGMVLLDGTWWITSVDLASSTGWLLAAGTEDGAVLVRRRNPSHYVDHQDRHVLTTGHVVCTGVGRPLERGGRKLGGIGVLRLEDLAWVAELPFPGYAPATGQVGTYNPMHLDVASGRLRLHLLPDQGRAQILTRSTPLLA